ncbi:MAG TPA: YfcE family phosphodiesterase [Euryarchaeota archaeon]|nr:YfcE family phosphodiesterase [Euryarchaeota archaeon]
MRFLAFSDIHNDWQALRTLTKIEADAYICAGDLTVSGKDIDTAIEILQPVKDRLYIVPGNNELPEQLQKHFPNTVHGRVVEFEGLKIGGIGGSPKTPWDTPFEWDENCAYRLLAELGKVDVFISHAPPKGTKLARTSGGVDAGSEAVRWYIESYQPEFAVVGHVHERAGITINIGKTAVFNPGPKGRMVEINL